MTDEKIGRGYFEIAEIAVIARNRRNRKNQIPAMSASPAIPAIFTTSLRSFQYQQGPVVLSFHVT